MDRTRWEEVFALLENGGENQLFSVRRRIIEKIDNAPDDVDGEVLQDLKRMKRLLDEELCSRGLFADNG
ncbi:MAG: hypothetical protein ABFS02_07435 [Pseudomonadota bacterium]